MTYNNDSNSSLTSLIMQGIMNALADTHTIIIGQIEKVNKTTIDVQPVAAPFPGRGHRLHVQLYQGHPVPV